MNEMPKTITNPKKRGLFSQLYFRYSILFSVYMLEYWEALIFNILFVIGVGLTIYSTVTYLPFWFLTAIDNLIQLAQ